MPEITKEKRIKQELKRISSFFERVDANQKAVVEPLLQNAAFMKVTLEDLQEAINTEGVTETYRNGATQYGVKQSATLQSYNALIKNYASVTKILSGLLPPEEKKALPPVWAPIRQKTEEERQREREEEERRLEQRNREIAEAVEYQRRQREEQQRKATIT